MPRHYLNQNWLTANWTLGNRLQGNINQSRKVFIHENVFNMASAKWWPSCFGLSVLTYPSMMRRNTSFSTNSHAIVYTKLVQLYTFKLTASFLKGKLASIVHQSTIEYFAITLQFIECVVCGVRQCAAGNLSISTMKPVCNDHLHDEIHYL